jgi:dienelactone hydrolase
MSDKTFDLTQIDSVSMAEEGAPLEIVHPLTRQKMGITIVLRGADSTTYREKQLVALRKRMEDQQRKGASTEPQQILKKAEGAAVEILAACTVGWTGVEERGKEIAFSEAAAKDVYTRYPVIREQVSAFIEDRRNFLPTLGED